MARRFYLALLC